MRKGKWSGIRPNKSRVRQLKDQPALRRGLDQRSGVAKEKAAPENKIIAMTKGAKGVGKKHLTIKDAKGRESLRGREADPATLESPPSCTTACKWDRRAPRRREVRRRCGNF